MTKKKQNDGGDDDDGGDGRVILQKIENLYFRLFLINFRGTKSL